MIVGAAPNVEENYNNIKKLLNLLDLESLGDCPFSVDIKVMLLLCGKQSASCKHNCPYCECFAPFTCPCPANTLESLATHHSNYQAAGSKKSTAMKYNNCTQPALISGSPDKTMLEVFSFPELHVMTGMVGKLVKEMIAAFPNREAGKSFINLFMKQHNISWCDYMPGTLEGNQARKLLFVSPMLEVEARKLPLNSAIPAVLFCKTMVLFNKVVEACFGQKLYPSYEVAISRFEHFYRRLDISVTPKVHCVFVHIKQFLELKGEVTGLGAWSEQAMESAHHEFKLESQLTKVGPDHPKYDEILFDAVVRFNAKHV